MTWLLASATSGDVLCGDSEARQPHWDSMQVEEWVLSEFWYEGAVLAVPGTKPRRDMRTQRPHGWGRDWDGPTRAGNVEMKG